MLCLILPPLAQSGVRFIDIFLYIPTFWGLLLIFFSLVLHEAYYIIIQLPRWRCILDQCLFNFDLTLHQVLTIHCVICEMFGASLIIFQHLRRILITLQIWWQALIWPDCFLTKLSFVEDNMQLEFKLSFVDCSLPAIHCSFSHAETSFHLLQTVALFTFV